MAQLTSDVDDFLRDLANSVKVDLSEEQQAIAGQLVDLLADIERTDDEVSLHLAGITLSRLANNPSHLPLCTAMVTAIRRRIANASYLRTFWRTLIRSPVGHVLAGMCVFVVLGLVLGQFILLVAWQLPSLMGFEMKTSIDMKLLDFVLIAAAGASGSLASIMTRLGSAEVLKGKDMNALFVTGMFKPFLGMLFGLFVAALYKSGLISIQLEREGQDFVLLTLAFVAGFSERLAKDIIRKVEAKATGAQQAAPPQTPQQPPALAPAR